MQYIWDFIEVCACTCLIQHFARRRNRWWFYHKIIWMCSPPCSSSSVQGNVHGLWCCRRNPSWVRNQIFAGAACVMWRGKEIWFDCVLAYTWSGQCERLCGTSAEASLPRRSLNGNLLLPESWKWESEDNRIPNAVLYLLPRPNALKVVNAP